MSKSTYNLSPETTLSVCEEIAREYERQGLRLTVRQLYYQLVSRGLEANGQAVYKRLVSILSTARLAGTFPMHLIEDRGRTVGETATQVSIDVGAADDELRRALHASPFQFLRAGRWSGQRTLPYVWVEKEALAGVFEEPCKQLGVGLFPCKGYPSLQALWDWLTDVDKTLANIDTELLDEIGVEEDEVFANIEILYFGDHDPDGLEIPESIARNLQRLKEAHADDLKAEDLMPRFKVTRVALTREQIRHFNPPPFPAKESSARYESYVEKTGLTDAWELDALDPVTLQRLIRAAVREHFDSEIAERVESVVRARRADLISRMKAEGWVQRAMRGE